MNEHVCGRNDFIGKHVCDHDDFMTEHVCDHDDFMTEHVCDHDDFMSEHVCDHDDFMSKHVCNHERTCLYCRMSYRFKCHKKHLNFFVFYLIYFYEREIKFIRQSSN